MNVILVIVVLSTYGNGLLVKTTTEAQVKSQEFCELAQLSVMNTKLSEGKKLISATCETTGNI